MKTCIGVQEERLGARSSLVVKDRKEDVVVEIQSNICLMTESLIRSQTF